MEQREPGVLAQSVMRFCTVSDQAKAMYFYPLCCGHYYCDGQYHISRQRYDSFLLLLVHQGEGYLKTSEGRQLLRPGSLAIVDCYQPHAYGTESSWEISWCHFDGPMARSFDTRIRQLWPDGQRVLSVKDHSRASSDLEAMLSGRDSLSEAQSNLRITRLLTLLLDEGDAQENTESAIGRVLRCISRDFDKPLSVEAMAEQASLSVYHFLRVFQRETGMTPHAYLLRVRMNAACFYLRSGDLSMQEIAWRCGFESASAFCKAFRRMMGQTPGEYRNKAE